MDRKTNPNPRPQTGDLADRPDAANADLCDTWTDETGKMYQCTSTGGVKSWTEVGGGGGQSLAGWNSVSSFGAVGNGVTVDTAALQAADSYTLINGGYTYLPPGTYLIEGTLTALSAWKFDPEAKLLQGDGAVIDLSGCTIVAGGWQIFDGDVTLPAGCVADARWWGADASASDNHDALDAAFSAVQAASCTLVISERYVTQSTINLVAQGFRLCGPGRIAAGDSFQADDALLEFPDSDTTHVDVRNGLSFDGNSRAGYAIYAPKINTSIFEGVTVLRTTIAGLELDEGWNNKVTQCTITNNTGDGVRMVTSINGTTITENTIAANSGFGIFMSGAAGVEIIGNTLGQNGLGDGYFVSCNGMMIAANEIEHGTTDAAWTPGTPADLTVHAAFIFNGSTNTDSLSVGSPSDGICVDANYLSSADDDQHCLVWASAVDSISLRGNKGSGDVALVGAYGNQLYCRQSGKLEDRCNGGFDGPVVMTFPSPQLQPFIAPINAIEIDSDAVTAENLFSENVFSFTKVVDQGASSTFTRAGIQRRGREVFAIDSDGNSDYWGFTLAIADHPELASQLVYVACEVMLSAGAGNAVIEIGNRVSSDSYGLTPTVWTTTQFVYQLPPSGSVTVGISKISLTANTLYVTRLVITPVGKPYNAFLYDKPATPQWANSAAPTAGTWAVGNRVENSAPASGQPEGWVCTVAGTPGTWKALANIA